MLLGIRIVALKTLLYGEENLVMRKRIVAEKTLLYGEENLVIGEEYSSCETLLHASSVLNDNVQNMSKMCPKMCPKCVQNVMCPNSGYFQALLVIGGPTCYSR